MKQKDDEKRDIIDEDLYEELEPEEMYELIQEEKEKLKEKELREAEEKKQKPPFPRWAAWTIAAALVIQAIAIIPQTFSIPAIEFIKTSATLMQDDTVQGYGDAVVVIEGDANKGTGFAITEDGYILTNHHVIEDQLSITVAFQEEGLFNGEVVETYPDIDLALLKVESEDLPHLGLAKETPELPLEDVLFIGNPLRLNGIANQGDIIGTTLLSEWSEEVYMLQAPVYRGNSGSPVMNEDGEVVAVIFATQKNETHGKIGLAVPIELYIEQPSVHY